MRQKSHTKDVNKTAHADDTLLMNFYYYYFLFLRPSVLDSLRRPLSAFPSRHERLYCHWWLLLLDVNVQRWRLLSHVMWSHSLWEKHKSSLRRLTAIHVMKIFTHGNLSGTGRTESGLAGADRCLSQLFRVLKHVQKTGEKTGQAVKCWSQNWHGGYSYWVFVLDNEQWGAEPREYKQSKSWYF